jgi:hypothetical protein
MSHKLYRPRYQLYTRWLCIAAAALLVAYLCFMNTLPYTYAKSFDGTSNEMSSLYPSERIVETRNYSEQRDDSVYFHTTFHKPYDTATVKMTYKNPSPDQIVHLGYQNRTDWHYNTKTLDIPFVNTLSWPKVSDGKTVLYQRSPTHQTPDQLLADAKNTKAIGYIDYTPPEPKPQVFGDTPSGRSNIQATFRGSVTFYAYSSEKTFDFSFIKRDLNWYSGADEVTAEVWQGKRKVTTARAQDDGNTAANKLLQKPNAMLLQGTGEPNTPYKITITASNDVLVSGITTSFTKVVAASPITLADNAAIYKGAVASTTASTVYTNAPAAQVRSPHNTSQTISVFDKQIDPRQAPDIIKNDSGALRTISAPRSDIRIETAGWIAFSSSQFFEPEPVRFIRIASAKDLAGVDYLITDYQTPKRTTAGWQTKQLTFGLNDAVAKQDRLSWIVRAPNLRERGATLHIQSYSVSYSKQGWLND